MALKPLLAALAVCLLFCNVEGKKTLLGPPRVEVVKDVSKVLPSGLKQRIAGVPIFQITWTLPNTIRASYVWRGKYSTVRLRAGSLVRFTWGTWRGLYASRAKCLFKGGVLLARPSLRGNIVVKIPRGNVWFNDSYGSNCRKGIAILIQGY